MVNQIDLNDFTGGISERLDADDFGESQWARIKGLVLDSATVLRSQFGIQRLDSTLTGVATGAVVPGDTTDWLVVVKTDGTVWYAEEPAWTDSYTTTAAATFTQLTTDVDGTSVTAQTGLQPVVQCPVRVSGEGLVNALLLHTNTGGTQALTVWESSGTLVCKVHTDFYPSRSDTDGDGKYTADAGVWPHGTVGTMWGDFVCVADTRWFDGDPDELGTSGDDTAATTELSQANTVPYPNGVWLNEGGEPTDRWDPISILLPVSSHARVLGLHALGRGLLILSDGGTDRDGVVLLQGDAVNMRRVPLRSTTVAGQSAWTYWDHIGSVCWVDDRGQVWSSNGSKVYRIDEAGPDHEGAVQSATLSSCGPWLLLWRDDRLLCMRAFGESGSWTELVPPAGTTDITDMWATDECVYLVDQDGALWRINIELDSERGLVDGTATTLQLGTATLAAPEHEKGFWFRFGVTLEDVRGDGTVEQMETLSGPLLADTSPVSLTETLQTPAAERTEHVVRMPGPSREASAEVQVSGDVRIEGVTFWVKGRRMSR